MNIFYRINCKYLSGYFLFLLLAVGCSSVFDGTGFYDVKGRTQMAEGKYAEAIGSYRLQVEAARAKDSPYDLYFAYYNLANAYYKAEHIQEAEGAYRQALFEAERYNREPSKTLEQNVREKVVGQLVLGKEAHFRLGTLYEQSGDFTRAKKEYQESLAIDPEYFEAMQALLRIHEAPEANRGSRPQQEPSLSLSAKIPISPPTDCKGFAIERVDAETQEGGCRVSGKKTGKWQAFKLRSCVLGVELQWYLQEESHWENGLLHGVYKSYWDNLEPNQPNCRLGKPREEGSYFYGRRHGRWVFYDKLGRGRIVSTIEYDNGKRISE